MKHGKKYTVGVLRENGLHVRGDAEECAKARAYAVTLRDQGFDEGQRLGAGLAPYHHVAGAQIRGEIEVGGGGVTHHKKHRRSEPTRR